MRLVGVGRSLGVRVCGSLGDVGMGAAAGVAVGTAGMRPTRPGSSAGDGGAVAHAFQRLLDPVEKRNRCEMMFTATLETRTFSRGSLPSSVFRAP